MTGVLLGFLTAFGVIKLWFGLPRWLRKGLLYPPARFLPDLILSLGVPAGMAFLSQSVAATIGSAIASLALDAAIWWDRKKLWAQWYELKRKWG